MFKVSLLGAGRLGPTPRIRRGLWFAKEDGGVREPNGNSGVRLWGGRFQGGPAEALARLSVSVQFDWRLAAYDLAASRAHARVLAGARLPDADELRRMLPAPDDPQAPSASGPFRPTAEDE